MADAQTSLQNRIDAAFSRRLGEINSAGYDTRWLDSRLCAALNLPVERRSRWRIGLGPALAAGAGLAAVLVLGVTLLLTMGSQVHASPADMLQLHGDLVAGRLPATHVESIAQANVVLAGYSPGGPVVPQVPEQHVLACCVSQVKSRRMACVLLRDEGVPVTMAVALASEVRPPDGKAERISRGDVTYLLHQQRDLAMVSHVRAGRWICMIGRLPPERLVDLSAHLRFEEQ